MADFLRAMADVFDLEGVYSNHREDAGKETVFGISRAYNPSAEVWPMVDRIKAEHPNDYAQVIRNDHQVRDAAMRFYKAAYWDPLLGDHNPSQRIANELLDISINIRQGKRQAVQFVQRALNGLNSNALFWEDVAVDGVLGQDTLYAIKQCISRGREESCVKLVNCIQGCYYLENSQETFLHGLLRRVKL